MFCSSREDLNGLSKFDKEKLIEVCEYTLKVIIDGRNKKKEKRINEIRKSLICRSTGFSKYLPWNWWIKEVNRDVCLKYLENMDDRRICLDYEISGWGTESVAKKILKLCRRSDSNAIYLDGNDVSNLIWPK